MAKNIALVIEHSRTFRDILSQLFTSGGFEVEFCQDMAAAQQLLDSRDYPYALILVAHSSVIDESAYFALSLRTQKRYAHTPLVLLTSHVDEIDKSFYAVGFTCVFHRAELGKLKSYLDNFLSRGAYSKHSENHVVIIEDDLPQQAVIKAILENHHCRCTCFVSAEAALAAVEGLDPDVIVVDFFLEGKMTGMDFITDIRVVEHPWQKIPILATTGLDDPARKYEFLRAGANDYLVKPIETIDLTVRVENLIRYKKLLDTVEAQREEMRYLAMHDQLTGLYNRHFMAAQVSGRLKEARRHRIPYSLIVMDIDHFKQVNDSHGHDKGDEVLKDIAQILRTNCRGEDIVARLGGEEFVVFLGYCSMENALNKAEQLRVAISTERPGDLEITASFGVAEMSDSYSNFDKLFKAADEAVYRAKNSGRNRVESA